MKKKYLLVYSNQCGGQHKNVYFDTQEKMEEFIKDLYDDKTTDGKSSYWKVLYKFELKEIK